MPAIDPGPVHLGDGELPKLPLVCLIGGGLDRHNQRAAARRMYKGRLFAAQALFAARFERWYIISARYGVLTPDEVIDPYPDDARWWDKGQRENWIVKVTEQLKLLAQPDVPFVVTASGPFLTALQRTHLSLLSPIAGMGTRRRMTWLEKASEDLACCLPIARPKGGAA